MTSYTLTAGAYFITVESVEFATADEAVAAATIFPKSARAGVRRLAYSTGCTFRVVAEVKILADKTNGGSNEAGMARLKTIFRSLDKAGAEVALAGNNFNHTVATVAEFRARYGL